MQTGLLYKNINVITYLPCLKPSDDFQEQFQTPQQASKAPIPHSFPLPPLNSIPCGIHLVLTCVESFEWTVFSLPTACDSLTPFLKCSVWQDLDPVPTLGNLSHTKCRAYEWKSNFFWMKIRTLLPEYEEGDAGQENPVYIHLASTIMGIDYKCSTWLILLRVMSIY